MQTLYVLINLGGESLKNWAQFCHYSPVVYYPNAAILVTPSHNFVNGDRRQAFLGAPRAGQSGCSEQSASLTPDGGAEKSKKNRGPMKNRASNGVAQNVGICTKRPSTNKDGY